MYNDTNYQNKNSKDWYVANVYDGRMKDQLICHAINPLTVTKSSWNMDTNRPDVSLWATYTKGCNPKY